LTATFVLPFFPSKVEPSVWASSRLLQCRWIVKKSICAGPSLVWPICPQSRLVLSLVHRQGLKYGVAELARVQICGILVNSAAPKTRFDKLLGGLAKTLVSRNEEPTPRELRPKERSQRSRLCLNRNPRRVYEASRQRPKKCSDRGSAQTRLTINLSFATLQ